MRNHVRILILDGDKYTARLMEREISGKFPDSIVVLFHTAQRALEELEQNRYDAAVIDYETANKLELDDYVMQPNTVQSGTIFLDRIRESCRLLPLIVLIDNACALQPTVGSRSLSVDGSGVVLCLAREKGFHAHLPEYVVRVLARRTVALSGSVTPWDGMTEMDSSTIEAVTGKLSHEVNNPLMTILGMTELLLDDVGGQDEEYVKKLRIIRKSAQRIAVVLSRLSSGEPVSSESAGAVNSTEVYTRSIPEAASVAEFEKP